MSTMANAAKRILTESLVIPIGASLPSPPFPCFLKACPPSDPRDFYGKYPTNFCTMAAADDATEEEVSVSRQGPVPT